MPNLDVNHNYSKETKKKKGDSSSDQFGYYTYANMNHGAAQQNSKNTTSIYLHHLTTFLQRV